MAATLDEQEVFQTVGGIPVVGGSVYYGERASDPQTVPIDIFSDREFTTPLANPQLTNDFGRTVNKVWVNGPYSIEVRDSNDVFVYQDLDRGEPSSTDIPPGYVTGWEMSINGTDPDHDFDMSAGEGQDDTQTYNMQTISTFVKQIDAVWSAGSNAGALDTGTIAADTIYNVFVIYNPTTDITDFIISVSGSPTFPTGYSAKLLRGTLVTDSSANILEIFNINDNPVIALSGVGGTANAITAIGRLKAVTSLQGEFLYTFLIGITNFSSNVTLNIEGLGAKTIVKDGNKSLSNGDLPAGNVAIVAYLSDLDKFSLISSAGIFPVSVGNTQGNSQFSTTTVIPVDNTTPQSSEGAEITTLSFTFEPESSLTTTLIEANVMVSLSTAGFVTLALFLNSNTDASAAVTTYISAAGQAHPVYLKTVINTNDVDLSLRFGPSTGTAYVGQLSTGTALFNAATIGSLTATELPIL